MAHPTRPTHRHPPPLDLVRKLPGNVRARARAELAAVLTDWYRREQGTIPSWLKFERGDT